MTSVSSAEIRAAIAYSSSGGSGTQVVVRWRSFTLGSYSGGIQPVTINAELNVNPQGASNGGAESENRRVSIWLNGTQVLNQADAFVSNTYNATGRLSTIRVALSAEGRSNIALGPAKTGWANASFDYSITLTDINAITDFVFIETSLPKFVQLPPVTSNPGKFLYFKIRGSIPGNNIGNNVDGNGDQFQGRSTWVNTYNGDSVIQDVNSSAIYINQSYGCLTLFSDGTSWYVANYYPSYLQGILPASTTTVNPGYKRANATTNCINIFSTNTAANIGELRKSESNAVDLPALDGTTTPPQMCIVVYSGDTSAYRDGNNPLIFYSNYEIEANIGASPPYTSTSRPYIVCNQNTKNTGVVFISDGLYWYIAGWFNGSNWDASSSIRAPNSGVNVSLGTINSNTMDVLSTNGAGNYYVLPQNSITNPYVFAVKAQRVAATMLFDTMPFGGSSQTVVINNNIKSINFLQDRKNTCVWFVRTMSGSTMIYYPIISYTPGS